MKNAKKIIRILSWFIFVIYLIALVYFLFFSEQLGRVPSDEYKYSLVPFKEIKRYLIYWRAIGGYYVLLNLLGNIVCFMPFGFVLPVISRNQRKFWKITLLSFLTSLLVELIQLVSKVGSCDVDDMLLNTLGGMAGYVLFRIFHRLLFGREKKSRRQESQKAGERGQ